MAESFLERFGSNNASAVRHPSWRVYKAFELMNTQSPDSSYTDGLSLTSFGLKDDIKVYYPVEEPDDIIIELVHAMTEKDYKDDVYLLEPCINLFLDVDRRQILEGLIMSNKLPEDISLDTGYSLQFIAIYMQAFFDMSVWRTDADKMHYIYRGTVGKEAVIKRKVVTHGIDQVLAEDYNMADKVKFNTCLATLFGISYSKAVMYADRDSMEDQHNAHEWINKSLGVYKELKDATASEGGIRELRIALETKHAPRKSIADLD